MILCNIDKQTNTMPPKDGGSLESTMVVMLSLEELMNGIHGKYGSK